VIVDPQQRLRRELHDLTKRTRVALDPFNILVYRLLHKDVPGVPPIENRIRVGSRRIRRFMEAGRNCYTPIRRAIDQYYRGPSRPRVLDFGCGVGRVLQYFARDNVELYACDVDASAIEYVRRTFPAVQSAVNRYDPPLPYPDAQFDVVYSVSIWTHLPPHAQIPWLLEIRRVLAPGGLALITTIGPYGYRIGTHLGEVAFSLEDLLREGFCYSEYKTKDPGTGPSYGAGYHTPAYVAAEWGKYFDILGDVQEGVIDNLNDLVVLQKRPLESA